MPFFMKPECALTRLVKDEDAPIGRRVQALKLLAHPELRMLRDLLWEPKTPRAKPVPVKLKALAAIRYKQEMELRKIRKLHAPTKTKGNSLGI